MSKDLVLGFTSWDSLLLSLLFYCFTVTNNVIELFQQIVAKKYGIDKKKYVFLERDKKIYKTFCGKKSFSVLRAVNGTLPNTLKLFCKTLNNDGNKWLLLDVNPKTTCLDVLSKTLEDKKIK